MKYILIEIYKSRFLPTEELVITILALYKAGLAYVPIAPNWPEGRVKHVIEDASPIMIVTNQGKTILQLRSEKKRFSFIYYTSTPGEQYYLSFFSPRTLRSNTVI